MAEVVELGDPPAAARAAADTLEQRLRHRTARVAVVGLGYVGLPLVRAAAEAGFFGLGLDIDRHKVEALNAGRSYIRHIPDEAVAAVLTAWADHRTPFHHHREGQPPPGEGFARPDHMA